MPQDLLFDETTQVSEHHLRVLHTADWHLGQRLCDQDRIAEHAAFLDWLLYTVQRERIDALIHSGDVFDSANPPAQALQAYYEFLARLMAETSCRCAIITGGNHDSPAVLNAPRILLAHHNIHVVGDHDPKREIIRLYDKAGDPAAVVCAVPFLRDRDLRHSKAGERGPEREARIRESIGRIYAEAARSAKEKRPQGMAMIATGHLFAAGGVRNDSEKDIHVIGNLGQVGVDSFPEEFDYVALGHLHRPQKVGGAEHVRYSGSPIRLDFSEHEDRKFCLLAEFGGGKLINVRELEFPEGRRLLRLRGETDELVHILQNLPRHSGKFPMWIEVRVLLDQAAPELDHTMREALGAREDAQILKVIAETQYEKKSLDEIVEAAEKLEDLSEEEVFRRRCESLGYEQEDVEKELMPAFRELLAEMREAEEEA